MTCIEGQGFGQNYNPSYHSDGLIGHPGIDIACGYGTPINALTDGVVYSTFPIDHPASDGYTAIFTLCKTPLETFEFSYGHVSEIDCTIGQQVKAGDVIAKEGNHGTVYSGNVLITIAMEAAGDQRGHHRHYQKRPVIKVPSTIATQHYLTTEQGIYFNDGYYEVYNYDNGFNGCVDWTLPLFNRNLFFGLMGYDVYLLQKALVLECFATFEPTGFFGALTLSALVRLQNARGIPSTGFCGSMTRQYLNKRYQQLLVPYTLPS